MDNYREGRATGNMARNETGSGNDNKQIKEKPIDDAFKTANRKHKLEWKEPQDEQMFDHLADE
jgi:hypothetical protein